MKNYLVIAALTAFGIHSKAQTVATLRKDMYGIASDATEGRFTGSRGYLKAADYVVGQLAGAGIKETQLQPVPFTWDDYSGSTVRVRQKTFPHHARNFIIIQRGIAKAGKWVVMLPGEPVKGNPAGIIWLPTARQANDWETTVIRQYRFGYMHYLPDGKVIPEGTPIITVSPSLARLLAPGDSVTVKIRFRSVNKPGYNVIGIVHGTDRKLSHQAIIVGAHLDHVGRIGNHIYNGANDDASGCVAEMGAAKALAAHPGKRTVVFAFFCGEELNRKGSRWFVDHMPAPKTDILMSVNLEQLGSKHRSFDGVWALGDTAFKTAFYNSGMGFIPQNLKFSPADSVIDILSDTDCYSFMKEKIPSLLLGSGGFDEHHTPHDKIELIDFGHLQRATRLLYNFLVLTADQPLVFASDTVR